MFKTPLIQLASLGLFMAGAQADCVVPTGVPTNTGTNMGSFMTVGFLNSIKTEIDCTGQNCEIIAETPDGLLVGRTIIGTKTQANVAIWGDDSTTTDEIDGAENGDIISLHVVDDDGALWDLDVVKEGGGFLSYQSNLQSTLVFTTITLCNDGVLDVLGCTDASAANYNAAATQDNGSCVFPVLGCTDEEANNYNAAATEDNGSCIVPDGTTAKRDKGKNKAKNKLIAAGLDGTLVDKIGSLAITDGKRGIGSIMSQITGGGYEVRKSVIRAALAEGNEVSFDLDDDANIPQSIKDALEAKTISKVVAKQGKTRDTAKKAALLVAADGAAICGGNDVDVYIEDVPAGEMVEVVFEAVGDVSIKCWDQTRPLSHMALTSEDPPTAKVRCWDVDQWANPITVNQNDAYVCQSFKSYMLSDGIPADVDTDGDGVTDGFDAFPDVASVQTCAHQEDYWLDAGCACGGGAGGDNYIGSTAWCDAQKDLWTAAGCRAQCPAQ